jgi:hypothetical protein
MTCARVVSGKLRKDTPELTGSGTTLCAGGDRDMCVGLWCAQNVGQAGRETHTHGGADNTKMLSRFEASTLGGRVVATPPHHGCELWVYRRRLQLHVFKHQVSKLGAQCPRCPQTSSPAPPHGHHPIICPCRVHVAWLAPFVGALFVTAVGGGTHVPKHCSVGQGKGTRVFAHL